jgi:hypothetical protein
MKTNENYNQNQDFNKSLTSSIRFMNEESINESFLKIGNQLKKHEVNIYKNLLEYDTEFKGIYNINNYF